MNSCRFPSSPPSSLASTGSKFSQWWKSVSQLRPPIFPSWNSFQLRIRSQDQTPLRTFRNEKVNQQWNGRTTARAAAAAAAAKQHNESSDQTHQSLLQVHWLIVKRRRKPFDDKGRLDKGKEVELDEQLQGPASSTESSEIDANPAKRPRKFFHGQLGDAAKSSSSNCKAGQRSHRRNTNDGELERR